MGFSKMFFVAFLSSTPISIIVKPKVAHRALISAYEDGGLKDIDIEDKIKSLRLSWVGWLYGGNISPKPC